MSTAIQWTSETWNPVRGCSRVSSGCDNCYAMGQAHRFSGEGQPYEGLTILRPRSAKRPGVDWAGKAVFVPEQLAAPLGWRKPRRIFVNSMSDLFHESLSNEEIAAVFGVMAACPQHTFQVLTKRPKRAAEWFKWVRKEAMPALTSLSVEENIGRFVGSLARTFSGDLRALYGGRERWPLPNVHLGVSAENQETYNDRVPVLVHQCPAALYWVSLEPLLGPVKLRGTGHIHLGWVVVGGESGYGARPFDVQWARNLIAECRESEIPAFVKQLGAKSFNWDDVSPTGAFRTNPETGKRQMEVVARRLEHPKGGDPSEWPEDLRVREYPKARAA